MGVIASIMAVGLTCCVLAPLLAPSPISVRTRTPFAEPGNVGVHRDVDAACAGYFSSMSIIPPNESMESNSRKVCPPAAQRPFEQAFPAQAFVSAAVAYFGC